MSKRRQKGTINHSFFNLFEEESLSADVGFKIVEVTNVISVADGQCIIQRGGVWGSNINIERMSLMF